VKNRRNNELLELQNRISEQDNQRFLGERVEVLVEGLSDRARRAGHRSEAVVGVSLPVGPNDHGGDVVQLTGRTPCDRIVVFDGTPRLIGQIIPLAIYDVSAHTLFGAVVTDHYVGQTFLSAIQ